MTWDCAKRGHCWGWQDADNKGDHYECLVPECLAQGFEAHADFANGPQEVRP